MKDVDTGANPGYTRVLLMTSTSNTKTVNGPGSRETVVYRSLGELLVHGSNPRPLNGFLLGQRE